MYECAKENPVLVTSYLIIILVVVYRIKQTIILYCIISIGNLSQNLIMIFLLNFCFGLAYLYLVKHLTIDTHGERL